jgi:DNA-binding LacI/PurR family transcriptional regulator
MGLTHDALFMAWPSNFSTVRVLTGLPMRFTFVGCLDDKGYNCVITDRGVGVRQGVELLLKMGRRRIARFGLGARGRRTGFDAAFAGSAASQAEKHEITTPGLEFRDGYEAGAIILDRKIDAVFFETDRMAFGFYKFAYEHGIKVPDDVAVIGFDDDPAGLYAFPPLSTVAHPIEQITDQVLGILRSPEQPPKQVWLPTRFIPRASV